MYPPSRERREDIFNQESPQIRASTRDFEELLCRMNELASRVGAIRVSFENFGLYADLGGHENSLETVYEMCLLVLSMSTKAPHFRCDFVG